MRALKRLKEQLRVWREASGCGFDPSLLSDVAREVILFLLLHNFWGVTVFLRGTYICVLIVCCCCAGGGDGCGFLCLIVISTLRNVT